MEIAFIGLGNMGGPMAANLLKAGHALTVFDLDAEWEFRREETASKSVNNPFYGWTLKGRNAMTIVAGEIAWQ